MKTIVSSADPNCTIIIGQNASENEHITLELAKRGDYWLHIMDHPGSHVVVKAKGHTSNIDAVLTEAAHYAVVQGRSKKEKIMYQVGVAFAQHVTKEKYSRKGSVHVHQYLTTIQVKMF